MTKVFACATGERLEFLGSSLARDSVMFVMAARQHSASFLTRLSNYAALTCFSLPPSRLSLHTTQIFPNTLMKEYTLTHI